VCLAAFDYFADAAAAVSEMARVLRAGGTLALMLSVVSATVAQARGDRSRATRVASALRAAGEVGALSSATMIGAALLERDRPHTNYYTRAQCTALIGARFELLDVHDVALRASTIVYIAARKRRRISRLPVIA
jgi:hypothetical protein